ncbi:MAG: hypothetical protein R3F59_20650 [Myxococcota bacterium]
MALLRGKRDGAFDTDQYYLEQAVRARLARKARIRLRRMEPVVLVTPRWSQAQRFLDDVAVDLLVGDPIVRSRTLSLAPLAGRTPHQAWSWLVLALTEFCQLSLEGPAWQVVSRRGFRHVMRELFARADQGERRCLMIHGAEHLQVEALRDLVDLFGEHVRERRGPARFNLLVAGMIDAPHFAFPDSDPLVLPDFAAGEALEVLVEHVGPEDEARLRTAVDIVGGIPAMLDLLGTEAAGRIADLVADRAAVWRVLGAIATEVRRSFDIVAADEALLARMEAIARDGPQPLDPTCDEALLRAGLVLAQGQPDGSRRTAIRAPFLADLAVAG